MKGVFGVFCLEDGGKEVTGIPLGLESELDRLERIPEEPSVVDLESRGDLLQSLATPPSILREILEEGRGHSWEGLGHHLGRHDLGDLEEAVDLKGGEVF